MFNAKYELDIFAGIEDRNINKISDIRLLKRQHLFLVFFLMYQDKGRKDFDAKKVNTYK